MAGAVETGGQVASEVVGGLKAQPMLLAIVVLNVIGIGIAGYIGLRFLDSIRETAMATRGLLQEIMHDNRKSMDQLMGVCFPAMQKYQEPLVNEERKGSLEYGGPR